MGSRDDIYSRPLEQVDKFEFDERTAAVFEDMIDRSVPGYRLTVAGIGLAARHFAHERPRCYDLGCSLGAGLLAMGTQLNDVDSYELIGVDTSSPMLERCQVNVEAAGLDEHVRLRQEDVRETPIESASLVALNFTLQFLPLEDRAPLMQRIFDGLLPGGALILSEKIVAQNDADEVITDLHHAFKRSAGYSEMEISQKRQSLENFLIRESLEDHFQRLRNVGFELVTVWLQCFHFVSILAVKAASEAKL